MEIKALYEVRHLTRTDLFAESGSGSFDFVERFTGEQIQAQVDERVRQLFSEPCQIWKDFCLKVHLLLNWRLTRKTCSTFTNGLRSSRWRKNCPTKN